MGERIIGIEQKVSAGNHFTGVVPTGTPTNEDGFLRYPEGAVGGSFELIANEEYPYLVTEILLKLGGQNEWYIEMEKGGESYRLYEGTTEQFFYMNPRHLIVPQGWAIKVYTSGGAPTGLKCSIFFERAFVNELLVEL